jgi:hypothetical protein
VDWIGGVRWWWGERPLTNCPPPSSFSSLFLKGKKHEKEMDEGGRGGKRSEEMEKERIEQHTHEHS